MKSRCFAFLSAVAVPVAIFAAASEITVGLKLDFGDYVVGEGIGAVVNIVNISPDEISVGYADSQDKFFVEVFRSKDMSQLQRTSNSPFVAPFVLKPNEGQKLATRLGDLYGLGNPGRFLARPVLVHRGVRYEGQMRAFDIVPGMHVTSALQMFANHDGLRREFELVSWSRGGSGHLFLTAKDAGTSTRGWQTVDLGEMMKITRPTISVMPSGEVIVLHRLDPDNFIRSEFWSVPAGIEFNRRELVQDPETAGSQRVRELYMESGGIKPKKNPWWKFW
jgi:hypothetical protein